MKSMREVDLDTYSLSLLTAKEDILNPRSSTNWALFTYDGIMNRLKLADSGGGLKELTAKLHPKWPLYGMCRVGKAQPRIAMILWAGNEVDGYRRAECASHLPAIRAFFKEVHIFLPAHTLDEITEERICTLAYNAAVVTQGPRGRPGRRTEDRQAIVGTNYKRTFAAAEILRIQRDSFWAQAEREEEERKREEQRRAAEDRKRREKERLLQERIEAIDRERRMNEKEQKIKEQRRIQAQMEAEARKLEKIKWEHEEREREEEEIRARYSCSHSEEKALVSQRAVNPREFFRQLSSSSVHITSHPSSTCPVRSPYRRLHRSQTDIIFSFNESPSSTPTSPYRSSVVSPYFPSTPTSRSPILFTSTTASSLPNGAMVSTKSQIQLSSPKLMETRLQTQPSPTTDATESEIKTPVSDILDSLVFYPPPPTPEQLQSEIADEFPPPPPGFENSPEPSVGQPETLDDPLDPLLPPSCVLVPEPPARPLPALSVAPRMLKDLEPERDFTAWASIVSTVEEEEDEGNEAKEMKYEGKDATEEMYGERGGHEEERGGGEERAKNRGQEEHVGMTMEKHKSEKESNGKMMEKYESGKEQDGKMLEECESEEKQDGNIMEEREREEDKVGEIVEELESGKIIEEKESEKDGKDLEEHENERNMEEHEQDGKIVDASDSEKSMEISETEMKRYAKMMEKCGQETEQNRKMKEKCDEEHDSENEQAGKIMKEHEVEKIQDGGIMEEHECEKEQDWKINEEFKSENIQYAKIMEECGQDGKTVEKCEEEHKREKEIWKINIMEEDGKKGNQDGKIVNAFDSEKKQDETSMEGFETEEIHKCEEEHEIEKEQNRKMIEDCESEKIQDRDIEEHEREKEEGWKLVEGFETEKIQYVKILEECGQENEQDGKIVEKCEKHESEKEQERKIAENHENGKSLTGHESENEQDWKMIEDCGIEKIHDGNFIEEHKGEKEDWKVVEVFETERIHYVKIMEVCGQENEQDGKNVEKREEEHESEKEDDVEEQDGRRLEEQDCKIMEVFESEKEQDCKIGERHEDGKSLEEHEGGKEQNQKMTENRESEKIQYGYIMDEHECENKQDGMTEYQQDRQNQDNEQMSHVDVDRAVNVTVLRKEESYTEIIKRNEATKVGDENEKEQMDTPLIQTEEADAVFSQHAPLFQESHATEPSQINDACIPEIISTTQDKNEPQMSSTDTLPQINLPTNQVETGLSSLSNQGDSDMKEKTESVDSQASSETSKNCPDATSAEQTPDTETCATVEDEQTEMLQQDKIVDSSNDLAEGIDIECKTSPIAENQARTVQSDTAMDLKYSITHQLDPTNDISDLEEGEEAISLLASDTDVEQNLKCASDPDQVNEDIKHKILQNCETIAETPNDMRNDKIADEK